MKKQLFCYTQKQLVTLTLQIISLLFLFTPNLFIKEFWDEHYGDMIVEDSVTVNLFDCMNENAWCTILVVFLLFPMIFIIISTLYELKTTQNRKSDLSNPTMFIAEVIAAAAFTVFATIPIEPESTFDYEYFRFVPAPLFYVLLATIAASAIYSIIADRQSKSTPLSAMGADNELPDL